MFKKKLDIPAAADCFSNVKASVLDNGLRIYVNEKNDVPTVSVQAWVKTGSIHEADNMGCGLSHFLEHMLFQGAAGYSGNAAADTVNRLGGDINAYTSFGHTVYYIDLPSRHYVRAIDILGSIVTAPEFPEDKFQSEKSVILHEQSMGNDDPMKVLLEKLRKNMFLNHPVRHPIIGYKDKIETVDREMMAEYYRRRYAAERCFWVVSGNVCATEVFAEIERKLGTWARGNLSEPFLPPEPEQQCSREFTYTFPDPLVRIAIGYRVPEASHPDVPALDILSGILGQNKSSRLIQHLVTEQELAIGVSSYSYNPYFCGLSGFFGITTPEKAEQLKDGIFAEVEKIRKSGIERFELEREIIQQSTYYIRSLRSNRGIARIIGGAVLEYGSPSYASHYLDALGKVTVDDIRRVAERYFSRDAATVITLNPEAESALAEKTELEIAPHPDPVLQESSGGVRLAYLIQDNLPLIDICAVLPGGTIFEDEGNFGVSGLIAALLSAGTKRFSEEEFTRILDDNAIDFGVVGGANSIIIRMNCRKDRLDTAVMLMQSVMSEPAFGEKEFLREQRNLSEALTSRKLNPQAAAEDRMREIIFGRHPYSQPLCGKSESIDSISVDRIKDFYFSKCLSASRAVLGICGDIEEKQGFAVLEKVAGGVPWAKLEVVTEPPLPEFPVSDVSEKVFVPREQAVVFYALPGCDNHGDDKLAVDLLQTAMNHQTSSLFKTVREDSGLAYYTAMSSARGIHPGYITFFAGTAPDTAAQVIELLGEEHKRLLETGLTEDEFISARENVLFALAGSQQSGGGMLTNCCLSEYYGNGCEVPWQLAERYKALTLDEANRTIRKYMNNIHVAVIASSDKA